MTLKTSILVDDGRHNGFPDLIYWQDYFYLVFRVASNHIDQNSCIKIMRSSDSETWEVLAELRLPHSDIRDPKFCAIKDRLFLYALKNRNLSPLPYTTVFSSSQDGAAWADWQDVSPSEWVFWRPKTWDGRVIFVAADHRRMKYSALFSSSDGEHWSQVASIYRSEFNAEIELAQHATGAMHCTIRVEGLEGNPKTLIGFSEPPFLEWKLTPSHLTRLDGAGAFCAGGRVYSVGRFEPGPIAGMPMGNPLNRKRTSLFCSDDHSLVWLADFPSAGDTGYAAAAVLGATAYIVYYTSDPNHDYPWVIGQFNPTQIRMARLDLELLERGVVQMR